MCDQGSLWLIKVGQNAGCVYLDVWMLTRVAQITAAAHRDLSLITGSQIME